MKYGYARVSTDDHNADMRKAALKRAGARKIYTDDGLSGATTKRPALLRCLKAPKRGDTLTVWTRPPGPQLARPDSQVITIGVEQFLVLQGAGPISERYSFEDWEKGEAKIRELRKAIAASSLAPEDEASLKKCGF